MSTTRAEEIAEKIVVLMQPYVKDIGIVPSLFIDVIAEELDSAYAAGRAAGLEEAAKVIENPTSLSAARIAAAIRLLAKWEA